MGQSTPTTWRILPTNGGQFQWAIISGDSANLSKGFSETLASDVDDEPRSRLPSMADILLQADQSSYVLNRSSDPDQHDANPLKSSALAGKNSGGHAMFSTGSGRILSVKPSSIQKAMSILDGESGADLEHGNNLSASCGGEIVPMFVTGLGKSVQVRQSSIKKAAALLEGNHADEGIILCKDTISEHRGHELRDAISTCPLPEFHTAGGRSISISSDALKRAKNILDDSEFDPHKGNLMHKDMLLDDNLHQIKNSESTRPPMKFHTAGGRPISISLNALKHASRLLIDPISEVYEDDEAKANTTHIKEPFSSENRGILTDDVLVDISNNTGSSFANNSQFNGEKKRVRKENSSSSFKKPRISRFTTPLNCNYSNLVQREAEKPSTSLNYYGKTKLSSLYPFQMQRKKLKEFFRSPPSRFSTFENVPNLVKHMTADNAENYRFHDASFTDFGQEAFRDMMIRSGASPLDTSEKWVANHYKWIVWKLACLERCYQYDVSGKFLTVSNVLEELKYRYDREVNYGHRSALKKILDGDTLPSTSMILCVSAIHFDENKLSAGTVHSMKIELTDGWYPIDATLDSHLSKQAFNRKLFVGQKIRVCGAALCGWVEPISPFEASNTISLALHINGTYRAHWADPLGFCKGNCAPLAFWCIKGGGGKVPRTLVGVTRLYPILFKERLLNGGSFVRSENMEMKILQLNSRRRSEIAEDIIFEMQDAPINADDSEEGAKLFRLLESSAEPEVLMAGMNSEQLASFSNYQAKKEALRQDDLHKRIEKSLEEAGLGSRDVTPFMKVRVVGMNSMSLSRKFRRKDGMITIWNPTEKQKIELVEGAIYSVSWLVPFGCCSDFLYLQSRGPLSEWARLPAAESTNFKPFFVPRKPAFLSTLGEVPLSSEFDIAAVVVYVGEAYLSGCHRRQWIFVSDGSRSFCSSSTKDEEHDNLLAVSFCSPNDGCDSLALINQRLTGNIVGFFNLIKRARDHNNHLWVSEATENSAHSLCFNKSFSSHLKEASNSAFKWAKSSSSALKKLEERVLWIIGGPRI